jgi:hypothetical protein
MVALMLSLRLSINRNRVLIDYTFLYDFQTKENSYDTGHNPY